MSFEPAPPAAIGMPLGSLDAVVFDTETTGLDTRNDRIIEIAGIGLSSGRIVPGEAFDVLVNPQMAIPESSTRIHGITDSDVAGSPDFRQAIGSFASWTGSRIMLGYSLFFDLAILEAEHGRHGILWTPPITLDVQELAQSLRPSIESWTMEAVADWLSVDIADRHRALADAKVTAEIFRRLVPLLDKAGVSTVGEAIRICESRRKTPSSLRHDTGRHREATNDGSHPYRTRIKEVMSSPPTMIDQGESLQCAANLMVKKGITSLFVNGLADDEFGILTESDILRALSSRGPSALDDPVGSHCSRPLKTIASKEFLYRAIVSMQTEGVRHFGVIDEQRRLTGAVSARNIFRGFSGDAVSLGSEIETAGNSAELGRVWSELGTVARSLAGQSVEPGKIAAIISRELRALTEKSCEIALSELADRLGPPPAPFSVLVLGSGGRGESLLAMDQDNAIIFDGNGDETTNWFLELGDLMTSILHEAGVKLCPGKIMASNRDWCMSIAEWDHTVSGWMARTSPSDLMNIDIFFDAMPVYGDIEIAEQLRDRALGTAKSNKPFLALLAKRSCDFKDPFGLLGRLKLDSRRRLDLKMHGLMPLFSAARALALTHGVAARSTGARLQAAAELGVCDKDLVQDLKVAHGILLGLVLRQQLRDSENGIKMSNHVAPAELDGYETQQLRWALQQVPRISNLLGVPAVF